MATVRGRFFIWRHLRADTNQYILLYKHGRLRRQGAGLAFWFYPLSTALAQLPVEDCETTFMLSERTNDYQDIACQITLTYRITDPLLSAARINFTISPEHGQWVEQPLERLASVLSQWAQHPARDYLVTVPVVEAIRTGPVVIRQRIEEALRGSSELAEMGLAVVNVQVNRISPHPEVERAIQTPARESIQQKADEAVFLRRAAAVEKERAIKENELATEIELARRQENLIQQQGANKLRQVTEDAQAEMAKARTEAERSQVDAESYAAMTKTHANADATALLLRAEAEAEGESRRVEIYRNAPGRVVLGLALQKLASHLQSVQHLNITPDMLGESFKQILRDEADR